MNKKEPELCVLEYNIICNECGDCEKNDIVNISSEDEIIEQLIYESERKADLI